MTGPGSGGRGGLRSGRPTGLLALVLVLGLVVGIWLVQGRDPGTPTAGSATEITDAPSATAPSTNVPSTDPPSASGAPGDGVDPTSGLPYVALSSLPPEASTTIGLIDRGGPYPYDQDDGIFNNFEGILPDRERGYYREYTVETPGSPDRGARRIVTGSGDDELYWTADHYDSFSRIRR